jgi:superoxide dismutase, Fe-Mn family
MKRRKFVKSVGMAAAAVYVSPKVFANSQLQGKNAKIEGPPALEFPALPFEYNALEPYIDTKTMEIHYGKHHQGYHRKFMNAIKESNLEGKSISEIFASVSKQSDAVRNNGGGYYNHLFFWKNLGKGSQGPSPELSAAITKEFGSLDKFKDAFGTKAKTQFGSGWGWLYMTKDKNLAVGSTPNQDNPLMDVSRLRGIPLLTIDVWEHAYYLNYQNKRPDYVDAFWNVVNWDEVNNRYKEALKG